MKDYLLIMTALLSFNLVLAQSDEKIGMEELPDQAHTLLHGKYNKYHINYIHRKLDKEDVETYEVELQKRSKLVTLIYDGQGELLSSTKSKMFTYDGTEPVKNSTGGSGGHAGHNHTH